MDYEKFYKEALERARAINDGEDIDVEAGTTTCEYIFPELKESEDERIRKDIVSFLRSKNGYMTPNEDWDFHNRWFPWLEKKADKFDVPQIKFKDAVEVTSRMKYIDDDLKPIAEFIMDYCSWNLHKDECNRPSIEVPLFRVLDALISRGKPYCEG